MRDVADFYRALLSGRLLEPAQLRAMKTTVSERTGKAVTAGPGYGLGIATDDRSACGGWGHSGELPGYDVSTAFSENGRRQAVLMINQDATTLPKAASRSTTSCQKGVLRRLVAALRRATSSAVHAHADGDATHDRRRSPSHSAGTSAPTRSSWRMPSDADTALVPLASGLIGLHIADDNFLQPEPGTSAADHLVSGLVPLALVAGGGACCTRAPRRSTCRARAAARLLRRRSPAPKRPTTRYAGGRSGDDYTGLLSLLDRLPARSAPAP